MKKDGFYDCYILRIFSAKISSLVSKYFDLIGKHEMRGHGFCTSSCVSHVKVSVALKFCLVGQLIVIQFHM